MPILATTRAPTAPEALKSHLMWKHGAKLRALRSPSPGPSPSPETLPNGVHEAQIESVTADADVNGTVTVTLRANFRVPVPPQVSLLSRNGLPIEPAPPGDLQTFTTQINEDYTGQLYRIMRNRVSWGTGSAANDDGFVQFDTSTTGAFTTAVSNDTSGWTRLYDVQRIAIRNLATTTFDTATTTANNAPQWAIDWREELLDTKHKNHRGQRVRSIDKGQMFSTATPEELVALGLLRKVVDTEQFRRYLKHGFVSVRGPSGLVYQIFRAQSARIHVYDKDEMLAALCVHLENWYSKPPTDEVVAKILIVELDEPDIWKRANVSWQKPEASTRIQHRLPGIVRAA